MPPATEVLANKVLLARMHTERGWTLLSTRTSSSGAMDLASLAHSSQRFNY